MNAKTQPFRHLIAEGRICEPRYFCPQPSLSPIDVGYSGIGATIIEPYLRLIPGKTAVVYCSTAAHAEATATAFNEAGVPAAAILGNHTRPQRDEIIDRFRRHELLVLVNVSVLLIEFRQPEVDAVIMAAPTKSATSYFSQVAAALVPRFAPGMPTLTSDQRRAAILASDKPHGLVLDVAGNVLRHGFLEDDRAPEPVQPSEPAPTVEPEQKPMVAVPVANLTKQALAYAVAVAEGLGDELSWCFLDDDTFHNIWTDDHGCYRPDEDWELGGQLITKHAIGFVGHDADNWLAFASPADKEHQGIGPTHLIAACRMIVRAQLGDTVQVPEELVHD